MQHTSRRLFGIVILVMLLNSSAGAQLTEETLGRLFLSSDPSVKISMLGTGSASDPFIEAFAPFIFYLVIEIDYCDLGPCVFINERFGLRAWEAQLDLGEAPDVSILDAELFPPDSVNFVFSDTNFLVGIPECVPAIETPLALVRFEARLTADSVDQVIRLQEATPATRVSPSWNQCPFPEGILHSFEPQALDAGFLVINPAQVSTSESSWGAVKHLFESGR